MKLRNKLIEEARNAAERAYCPYSNFHVGVALIDGKNKIKELKFKKLLPLAFSFKKRG